MSSKTRTHHQTERRAFIRVPLESELAWTCSSGAEGAAGIFNISRGGICFVSDRLMSPEHNLALRYAGKDEGPVEFEAKIAWSHYDGNAFTNGVKFLDESGRTLEAASQLFYAAIGVTTEDADGMRAV